MALEDDSRAAGGAGIDIAMGYGPTSWSPAARSNQQHRRPACAMHPWNGRLGRVNWFRPGKPPGPPGTGDLVFDGATTSSGPPLEESL